MKNLLNIGLIKKNVIIACTNLVVQPGLVLLLTLSDAQDGLQALLQHLRNNRYSMRNKSTG